MTRARRVYFEELLAHCRAISWFYPGTVAKLAVFTLHAHNDRPPAFERSTSLAATDWDNSVHVFEEKSAADVPRSGEARVETNKTDLRRVCRRHWSSPSTRLSRGKTETYSRLSSAWLRAQTTYTLTHTHTYTRPCTYAHPHTHTQTHERKVALACRKGPEARRIRKQVLLAHLRFVSCSVQRRKLRTSLSVLLSF